MPARRISGVHERAERKHNGSGAGISICRGEVGRLCLCTDVFRTVQVASGDRAAVHDVRATPGCAEADSIRHTLPAARRDPEALQRNIWADWIYVDDVIQGFLAAAQAPNLEGAEIDLGSGQVVSVRSLVNHLVNLTGSTLHPTFGALPDRPLEYGRAADVAGTLAKLQWRPTTPLLDGLQRTIDWYREHVQFAPQCACMTVRSSLNRLFNRLGPGAPCASRGNERRSGRLAFTPATHHWR